MVIFLYTFIIIFIALVLILGVGSLLTDSGEKPNTPKEGAATAAMCTTRLLGKDTEHRDYLEEDFVIEQDIVYTYDSVNI
jgi:hypothetical protein